MIKEIRSSILVFKRTWSIAFPLQVSMLEKQFGFSSAETGLLMSCNDIGYLCCVIFAGYIARKVCLSSVPVTLRQAC